MAQPLVSICIPAYKKPDFVQRCLQSISTQTYKHVEIIISDDSPDEAVKVAIEPFTTHLTIFYYHNIPALQSPKNWNAALNKAKGDLLMLMHQDDWFFTDDAIEQYVTLFLKEPEIDFAFCRNTAVDENGTEIILQARPKLMYQLYDKPDHLLLAQVIGPPSNTMLRKKIPVRYDEQFIWLVDVDYYVRLLKTGYKYHYINKHLVNIGLHEEQTTVFCRTHSDIIFKENILYAFKLDIKIFQDVLIYDYYWRLLRNYNIRTQEDFVKNGVKANQIPGVILFMLQAQVKWPPALLRKGFFSKTLMARSYSVWRSKSRIS